MWACLAVLALTVLLGALLWNLRNGLAVQPFAAAESVRWLVVSLAALTLPHLVLISACARILSPPQSTTSCAQAAAVQDAAHTMR